MIRLYSSHPVFTRLDSPPPARNGEQEAMDVSVSVSVPTSKSRNPIPSDPSPSSHPVPVMNPYTSSTSHPVPVMNPKPSSSTASSEEESGDDGSESKQQGPQLEPPLKPKAVPVAFDPPRSGSQKGQLILLTEESESEPETETEKKRKRKRKRKAQAPASEEKQLKEKSPFRRIWSSDDELTILQGMAEFLSDEDPSAIDMVAFHEFIRPSLKLKEVSLKQLRDKIHKLRVQYEAAVMRNITDPHEQKAYELYKRIWKQKKKKKDNSGHGAIVDNNAPPATAAAAAAAAADKTSYPLLREALNQMHKFGLNMMVTQEVDVLESVDDSKKAMMENKFKRMRLDGIKLYLRQMDLYKELAKVILDSLSAPNGS